MRADGSRGVAGSYWYLVGTMGVGRTDAQEETMRTTLARIALLTATAAGVLCAGAAGPASAVSAPGPSTWEMRQPVAMAGSLADVQFITDNTGWAVGQDGTVVKSTTSGASWAKKSVPTTLDLSAVAFASAARGWAVGEQGMVLRTIDGGTTWNRIPSKTTKDLRAISSGTRKTVVAVGNGGRIIRSTDGGLSWSVRRSPVSDILTDVRFFSARTVVAVAAHGAIIRSTDGGRTWSVRRKGAANPPFVMRVPYSSGVDSISRRTGWVTSLQGVFRTRDGGRTWSRVGAKKRLTRVDFVSSRTGYAILNADYEEWPPADAFAIYKTTNAGVSWRRVFYGSPEAGVPALGTFNAISFPSAKRGVVVGVNGTIVTMTDGRTWKRVSGDMPDIIDMDFVSDSDGWAARREMFTGDREGPKSTGPRTLLKTRSAGATWTQTASPSPTYLEWVEFASPTTGWVGDVAGHVFKTTDAANSWATETAISREPFFVDGMHGWAPDGNAEAILRTADGGVTWETLSVDVGVAPESYSGYDTIRALYFVSADVGWCIGYGDIFKTLDGGQTWSLQHASPNPYTLGGLRFDTADVGWALSWRGDSSKLLLKTTDGGTTWAPVDNSSFIDWMAAFADSDIVYGMHRFSTIFPENSLYRSDDGGLTWAQQTAPVATLYFQVAMKTTSPERGWLYGDHGQIVRLSRTAVLGAPLSASSVSHVSTLTVHGSFGSDADETGVRVRVYRWRLVSGDWKPQGSAWATVAGDEYNVAVKLETPGIWRLGAYHPADTQHNSSWAPQFTTVEVY